MSGQTMYFPDTVEEFMERYEIVDSKQVYTNGIELVPIFRMKQWFEQHPEPHWIPCSERMPGEHEWLGTKRFGTTISDEVYVTFENPKGERFCKHLSFQNGELSAFDKSTIDAFYKGSKPIAWMPLPEPYKGVTK